MYALNELESDNCPDVPENEDNISSDPLTSSECNPVHMKNASINSSSDHNLTVDKPIAQSTGVPKNFPRRRKSRNSICIPVMHGSPTQALTQYIQSKTIHDDSETQFINLIDEYPKKFKYLQRQWESAIHVHKSWNDGDGTIRNNYGSKIFQASSIIVSANFLGFEHSFRKREVYKENYDKLEKEMILITIRKTSCTFPKGFQNDTFVYLRQFEVGEGEYISHVLAKKEFEPGSFLCFFSGTLMHMDKSELLKRCQDPLNDFVTIPLPLAEVNQYFTWEYSSDDVVRQLKPFRPLVIQGYEKAGEFRLTRFYISTFLKYAQSIDESNCEVKLIREEKDNSPTCTRSRNIWFVRATRKIEKDEKLLLAPFWTIPEEESVSQTRQRKAKKRAGQGGPSHRNLVERLPMVINTTSGIKRKRTEEVVDEQIKSARKTRSQTNKDLS